MDQLVDRIILRITREHHLCGFSNTQILSVLGEVNSKSLESQPALIEIEAPIVIFGDIHGQLNDLLRFMTIIGPPPKNNFLFLGDYVDRCKKSFEEYSQVFNELPLCAVVSKRLICMHGGISPDITGWSILHHMSVWKHQSDFLNKNCFVTKFFPQYFPFQKPKTPRSCDEGVVVDLMWSDPSHNSCTGFQFNATRATSYIFGGDCVDNICDLLGISMIIRAHEVTPVLCDIDIILKKLFNVNHCRRVICSCSDRSWLLFSQPPTTVIMKVSDKMEVSFVTLKPRIDVTKLTEEKRIILEKMSSAINANSPSPCVTYVPLDIGDKQCAFGTLPCKIQKTDTQKTVKDTNNDVRFGQFNMINSDANKHLRLSEEDKKFTQYIISPSRPEEFNEIKTSNPATPMETYATVTALSIDKPISEAKKGIVSIKLMDSTTRN
uniref:SER_THR_PHOSPHATASE domain-containing protein n=1 Tax=Heterorhabditis bacteriophora TaxID=37862 RepID=A0A1I7X5V3_HETBA